MAFVGPTIAELAAIFPPAAPPPSLSWPLPSTTPGASSHDPGSSSGTTTLDLSTVSPPSSRFDVRLWFFREVNRDKVLPSGVHTAL
jgi:hypothetical protein